MGAHSFGWSWKTKKKMCVLLILGFTLLASADDDHLSISVSKPLTLRLPPGSPVEKSPGSTSGAVFVCERIYIDGLSRLHNLEKYAHTEKVKVNIVGGRTSLDDAEVCFHRNMSRGIGLCPQSQWEKLVFGAWVHPMSPFDNKLLDVRTSSPSLEILEVSIEEELLLYRVVFLVLGIFLLAMANPLSKSVVFYYGGAMAVGVILVILMVLFQGMRMLPTGRKNSLPIVIYASLVGVGSFAVRYLPGLLRSLLMEIGTGDDIYPPLVTSLLVCVILTGAWVGFWVVRKTLLTEDGSVDSSVAFFIVWSIRILSGLLILQSSLDPLLATVALVSAILFSSAVNWISKSRLLHRLQRHVFTTPKKRQHRKSRISQTPPVPVRRSSFDWEAYPSTFHETPDRKNFSNEEWESFTKESTKQALEELISSPDFSKWAVRNAERITLAPATGHHKQQSSSRWLPWFI
ncbi:hypothetical protein ACHQM5_024857 [Ranunculus cassubicifolius]